MYLHQRVIGQDEAVEAVCKAIRRARVGLKNPSRPIGSFIFSGPTGVGKTELAKALAGYFFGSEEAMIRIDMSEFMEHHTTSKLLAHLQVMLAIKKVVSLQKLCAENHIALCFLMKSKKPIPMFSMFYCKFWMTVVFLIVKAELSISKTQLSL